MIETKSISEEKKDIVKNLYISGISAEFIAMQIDLENSRSYSYPEGTWRL